MRRPPRSRVARTLVLLATALATIAATCDNQDLSGSFVMQVDDRASREVRAFRQPYIGRITLDFGLTNTSADAATFDITVQAQTTGEIDGDSCDVARHGRALLLTAVADDQGAPADDEATDIGRSLDRLYEVSNPTDDGWVEFRIRRPSTYRVYTGPDTNVRLFSDGLSEIDPIAWEPDLASCSELSAAAVFELDDGTYPLRISTNGARGTFLVEEACTSVRTVPRTCPGTAASIEVRDPITLDADGFVSGRVSANQLGIGDQAVIGLECAESSPGCSADLQMFFLVEQLECRTDNDCSNVSECSEDAYCLRVADRGCATAGGAPVEGPVWPLGVALLTLAARRRR